ARLRRGRTSPDGGGPTHDGRAGPSLVWRAPGVVGRACARRVAWLARRGTRRGGMVVASHAGMANASTATRDQTRALFLRIAETCDLPPLPAVAARAMSLARDPDACATDLARVVMTDTALAARVLKISRSVTYLRREPPRTLQEAIVVVGFQALRKILVAASARS